MSAGKKGLADPWAKSSDAVLAHFGVDSKTGLSDKAVAEAHAQYGFNELPAEERTYISML